jgi:hypothetical protein
MPNRQKIAEWISATRESDTDQTLSIHSWVSVKHKYLCVAPGKNACTRTKLTLHLLDGYELPDDLGDIHTCGCRLASFDDGEILDMLTSPAWFKFCFVRNPYERLISAYKTQVGNVWNKQYQWLKDDIKTVLGYPLDEEPERLVPFRDFVRYLRSADERLQHDGHFNVQARILVPEVIRYDYIGRFENFQSNFEDVLIRLNASSEVIATASEPMNKTSKVYPPAIAYDDELAELVFEIYEPDFKTFGYDRDYWKHA